MEKIKKYIFYKDFLFRTFNFLTKKISLIKLVDKLKHGSREKIFQSELSKTGGLTFLARLNKDGDLLLDCQDRGGLYDKDLNAEGTTWPDQVPVGYYSTSYATYCFYHRWKETRDEKWREACQLGIDFFIKNFRPYTWIAFDHYEFKILPLSLLILQIEKDKQEDGFSISSLKKVICDKWLSYEPVNIFALRLANFSLFEKLELNYSKSKCYKSLKRIIKNQTEQGLIMDNVGGAVCHSADLTYHQFSLVCLLLAYKQNKNKKFLKIINKALSFSKYIQLEGGHVSYFGRGANNIYHLASYFFVESHNKKRDLGKLEKILDLLLRHFDPDKGLPSALNLHREKRMGWNHCLVPYNGQSLFFLSLADDFLRTKDFLLDIDECEYKDIVFDYKKVNSEVFNIVVGRGADTQVWSDGAHLVGMGGLCALEIGGENIMLANGYSKKDDLWTSDLPIRKSKMDNNRDFRGKIVQKDLNFVELKTADCLVSYSIKKNIFCCEYSLASDWREYSSLGGFSIKKDKIKDFAIKDNLAVINLSNNKIVELKTEENLFIKSRLIKSNSFGEGIRFEWILKDTYGESYNKIKWELSVK